MKLITGSLKVRGFLWSLYAPNSFNMKVMYSGVISRDSFWIFTPSLFWITKPVNGLVRSCFSFFKIIEYVILESVTNIKMIIREAINIFFGLSAFFRISSAYSNLYPLF